MSELIFFILGGLVGGLVGFIFGGINMALFISKSIRTKKDVEEFKREEESIKDFAKYAKATAKAMH